MLQKKAVRLVANKGYNSHSELIFYSLEILKFEDLFNFNVMKFMHQYSTSNLPPSFNSTFTLTRDTDNRNIRDDFYHYQVSIPINHMLKKFPRVIFIPIWNALSSEYQCIQSHKVFSKDCKKFILDSYSNFTGCDNLSCPECNF